MRVAEPDVKKARAGEFTSRLDQVGKRIAAQGKLILPRQRTQAGGDQQQVDQGQPEKAEPATELSAELTTAPAKAVTA